jgi:tocopherol O-methyltransferase
MPATLNDVRAYYDRNTPLFLRFGSSPETQTIHRSLWPRGTRRLKDALAVSNNFVLEQASKLGQPDLRILDLGCGVGATLFHVLAGLGGAGRGVGLTLSSIQAHLAESARKSLGIANASFVQGDFHRVPLRASFNLIYSIEAIIHAQEPREYLAEVSRLLVRGGRLILLDDFCTTTDEYAQRWLKAYKEGWYVPNMQTADEMIASARDCGLTLVETHDLTPQLRLRALPDFLARSILWIGNKFPQDHPIVPSMLGSMALQQCLKAGWIEYRWKIFEKN